VRAVRSVGNGAVAVVDVAPSIPEHAREPVRVRVRSAGICGSDLHLVQWALPATLGHEFAGELDDGTPVAVQPLPACGECDLCRLGREHLCRHGNDRLHGLSVDGGLADEVVVDRACVVPLPDRAAVRDGALVEPLAVAVHATHAGGMHAGATDAAEWQGRNAAEWQGRNAAEWDGGNAAEWGDAPVLVIGGGSIGLAVLAVAREHGAEVDVAVRHAAQAAAAEQLGGRTTVGLDYELVVDCAGTQSSIDDALARVRPGGTVVLAGTFWEPVRFDTTLSTKEVRLVTSQTYGHHHGVREFDEAAAVLAARPEIADALVTHRFGLDDAAEAFRVAADRAAGAIKVVVEP
jgi:threonine dehydrogenase-like Zn-dependent dehydrogenase